MRGGCDGDPRVLGHKTGVDRWQGGAPRAELAREKPQSCWVLVGRWRQRAGAVGPRLILEITTEEMALLWYQDVQSHIVAQLAQDDFVIDSQEIVDCIVNEVKAEFISEARSPGGRPELEEGETRLATQAAAVEVNYRYTREDLKAIFDLVYEEDVERGGPVRWAVRRDPCLHASVGP